MTCNGGVTSIILKRIQPCSRTTTMSQYYTPHTTSRPRPTPFQSANQSTQRSLSPTDLDDSIYIFPSPPSAGPPSPLHSFGGSDISAPTDLTLSDSHLSEKLGRTGADVGRRDNTGPDGVLEVEIWDWPRLTHSSYDMVSENGSDVVSDLELDVDRAHRWEIMSYTGRRRPLADSEPGLSAAAWLAKQRCLDLAANRITGSSSLSPPTSIAEASGIDLVKPNHAMQKRRRPPRMLAFFASCLFVDDATLNLLTQPQSEESILFPGHIISYSDSEQATEAEGRVVITRGNPRSRASLRDDMKLACDPDATPFNPFAIPSARLSDIMELVNGLWTSGQRAWRST